MHAGMRQADISRQNSPGHAPTVGESTSSTGLHNKSLGKSLNLRNKHNMYYGSSDIYLE